MDKWLNKLEVEIRKKAQCEQMSIEDFKEVNKHLMAKKMECYSDCFEEMNRQIFEIIGNKSVQLPRIFEGMKGLMNCCLILHKNSVTKLKLKNSQYLIFIKELNAENNEIRSKIKRFLRYNVQDDLECRKKLTELLVREIFYFRFQLNLDI